MYSDYLSFNGTKILQQMPIDRQVQSVYIIQKLLCFDFLLVGSQTSLWILDYKFSEKAEWRVHNLLASLIHMLENYNLVLKVGDEKFSA